MVVFFMLETKTFKSNAMQTKCFLNAEPSVTKEKKRKYKFCSEMRKNISNFVKN